MRAAGCGGSGSARDRRGRTGGVSLLRRGCGSRGLRDGDVGRIGFCPTNGSGAGIWQIRAHVRRYQERYAQAGWRGWVARGLASRSPTYFRETVAQHREAEEPGMSNRAIAQRLGVSEMAIRKLVGPSKARRASSLRSPVSRPRQRASRRCLTGGLHVDRRLMRIAPGHRQGLRRRRDPMPRLRRKRAGADEPGP